MPQGASDDPPAPVPPRLCVGLPSRDDPVAAWFALHALRLYQPEVAAALDLVLIDQAPHGPAAAALRELAARVPGVRYLPAAAGARPLATLARATDAAIVCALDPRTLPPPGTLAALLDWFDAHPASADLVYGVPHNRVQTARGADASLRFSMT